MTEKKNLHQYSQYTQLRGTRLVSLNHTISIPVTINNDGIEDLERGLYMNGLPPILVASDNKNSINVRSSLSANPIIMRSSFSRGNTKDKLILDGREYE